MEHADVVCKLFQVSYVFQLRFLTMCLVIILDPFGVGGVCGKFSAKTRVASLSEKPPHSQYWSEWKKPGVKSVGLLGKR